MRLLRVILVSSQRARSAPLVAALFITSLAIGCPSEDAAVLERAIASEQLPALTRVVEEDLARHRSGIVEAAGRLVHGLRAEASDERERGLRQALRRLQEPPRGVPAFIASPMSFLAVTDARGIVLARDAEPDRMKGEPFAERYPSVRQALAESKSTFGVGEFEAGAASEPSSYSMLFTAPVSDEGQLLGAAVAGIPFWRMAQRLSRQLQVERADAVQKGAIYWVFMLKGDRIFSPQVGLDLEQALPSASKRRGAVTRARTGGGPTCGHVTQYGRPYGYCIAALATLGDDAGMLVVRANPL